LELNIIDVLFSVYSLSFFITNQSLYIHVLPVFFTSMMFESNVMVGIQPGLLRTLYIV
jgi:hypothetical protein